MEDYKAATWNERGEGNAKGRRPTGEKLNQSDEQIKSNFYLQRRWILLRIRNINWSSWRHLNKGLGGGNRSFKRILRVSRNCIKR